MINDDLFIEKSKTHYDYRDKEVGDRVMVWDTFACFNENGERIYANTSIDDHVMIVVSKDISELASVKENNVNYLLEINLKLYDTIDKIIVFTNKEFCKIL